MTRRTLVNGTLSLIVVAIVTAMATAHAAQDRPNILWISCEDISPQLGCYGDPDAITPNLDAMAERGIRYTHAFTTCPVCATNRSSIITGMYPTTIGSQYMRCRANMPDGVETFPTYLREAGYYCTNHTKTDYNLSGTGSTWNGNDKYGWRKRKEGQPFFCVINFTNTHESKNWPRGQAHDKLTKNLTPDQRQDTEDLTRPPYYPDTPESRRDWANYLENITQLDYYVADVLEELEKDGLTDDTIVFYWSDHGVGLPRGKRWPYDSGTHVPLIVEIPERWRTGDQGKPGTVSDELVSFIDLAPTVLNLAGVDVPDHMQGRAFLGEDLTQQREYVFNTRDRMDERYDCMRAVRDGRYRYIRNFMPHKPYAQWISYAERNETMKALRRQEDQMRLPDEAKLFMAEQKPVEELYDTQADPYEVVNLAAAPSEEHEQVLKRMRKALDDWYYETNDVGLIPEAIVNDLESKLGDRRAILQRPGSRKLQEQLWQIADGVGRQSLSTDELNKALGHEHPAVRYWALIGIGNQTKDGKVSTEVTAALEDDSPLVRVAAARVLWLAGKSDEALEVLEEQALEGPDWVRLEAVTVLDEMEEDAKPATATLEQARKDKKNGYVARVAERALFELQANKQ